MAQDKTYAHILSSLDPVLGNLPQYDAALLVSILALYQFECVTNPPPMFSSSMTIMTS